MCSQHRAAKQPTTTTQCLLPCLCPPMPSLPPHVPLPCHDQLRRGGGDQTNKQLNKSIHPPLPSSAGHGMGEAHEEAVRAWEGKDMAASIGLLLLLAVWLLCVGCTCRWCILFKLVCFTIESET